MCSDPCVPTAEGSGSFSKEFELDADYERVDSRIVFLVSLRCETEHGMKGWRLKY